MDVLANLRTFLAVSRHGNFSEAARQLHVVPSVVAKRIAQLETTMDTRLCERSTRRVTLTEAGEALQARAAGLVAGFDEVVLNVSRNEGKLEGHIRLMAPTTLTLLYLGEVLNEFLAEHERITLEVTLVDRSTNPLEDGFDMAISGRSATYDGVVDLPLCSTRTVLCASPGYLKARGAPMHPRELVDHDCLVFQPTGLNWQFQSARGPIHVDVRPRLTADDNLNLLRAAERGLGITILPNYVCGEALAAGRLARVMERFQPQETWFRIHVARRRQGLARFKALIDWLTRRMNELDTVATPRLILERDK